MPYAKALWMQESAKRRRANTVKRNHNPAGRVVLVVCMLAMAAFAALAPSGPAVRADGTGDAAYQRGVAAANHGYYTAAVVDYQQALLHGHTDPNTFYQLGLAYEKVKQWNYAAWAVAMALSDGPFSGSHPQASVEIDRVQRAGGVNAGPPPSLANVMVSPTKALNVNPGVAAAQEAQAAFTALRQGAYFVSPGFNSRVTFGTAAVLISAAQDSNNNSNTTVKFVYLDGTPSTYQSLSAYAGALFHQLGLSRAVLVVVTPAAAVAYSDRLAAGAAGRIVAQQWRTVGISDPTTLAANIARNVVKQADANDSAAQTKDIVIAAVLIVVFLGVIGGAMYVIMRGGQRQRGHLPRQSRVGTRTRVS